MTQNEAGERLLAFAERCGSCTNCRHTTESWAFCEHGFSLPPAFGHELRGGFYPADALYYGQKVGNERNSDALFIRIVARVIQRCPKYEREVEP